jgi:hypothetical protein
MRGQWRQSITRPIRAFKLRYVPVVVVYFAYGALGLIDVTRDLWEPLALASPCTDPARLDASQDRRFCRQLSRPARGCNSCVALRSLN